MAKKSNPAPTPQGIVKQWEYMHVTFPEPLTISSSESMAKFNELGQQGWELVTDYRGYWFKRPL